MYRCCEKVLTGAEGCCSEKLHYDEKKWKSPYRSRRSLRPDRKKSWRRLQTILVARRSEDQNDRDRGVHRLRRQQG